MLRVRILLGVIAIAFVFAFRGLHRCADSDETLPGMTPGQSEELKRRFHDNFVR